MTADALIGKQAGNYRLVERLGAGGMGEVYKGVHVSIGSKVAIKVLHATAARDRGLQERFTLEAQAVNRIEHSGVVKVIDAGRMDAGRPYLVMELLDGGSLHDLLKRGQLTWRDACSSVVAVLDALAAAHGAGVVHRDLKPANIFRTRDGRTVVLDFGIAKLLSNDALKLTVTGTAVGTPHYMAPEQIRGKPATPSCDIYAMGVTLFELVCGRRPFEDDEDQSVMLSHLNKRPPPPRALNLELPLAVQEVILTALAKEPDKRFATAGAMRDALRTAMDAPAAATPPGPAGAAPVVAAPAPAPVAPAHDGRSPWARPEPVDLDMMTTLPRRRRASQDAPTKAESPGRLAVMPPSTGRRVLPTTERDARTPDGVRAHRERSRMHLLVLLGAGTIAIIGTLVIVFGMDRSKSDRPPPAQPADVATPIASPGSAGARSTPEGSAESIASPGSAGARSTPEGSAESIDAPTAPDRWQQTAEPSFTPPEPAPPLPEISCAALATMTLSGAEAKQLDIMRRVFVERCVEDAWPQATVQCLVMIRTPEAMDKCVTTLDPARAKALADAIVTAAKPAPSPPVKLANVEISSTPNGADIFKDKEWLGRTPWSGKLPSKQVEISVKLRGCTAQTSTIKPAGGDTTVLHVRLRCSDPFMIE